MACFGKEHLAIAATLGLNDLPLISIALIFLRSFAATAHVSFPRAFFPSASLSSISTKLWLLNFLY